MSVFSQRHTPSLSAVKHALFPNAFLRRCCLSFPRAKTGFVFCLMTVLGEVCHPFAGKVIKYS